MDSYGRDWDIASMSLNADKEYFLTELMNLELWQGLIIESKKS